MTHQPFAESPTPALLALNENPEARRATSSRTVDPSTATSVQLTQLQSAEMDDQNMYTPMPSPLSTEMRDPSPLRSPAQHRVGCKRASAEGTIDEQLELYREEIRTMYLVQNMSLKEIMERFEERGFKASQRMYKRKLEKWKFFKNIRRKDVHNMLYYQNQRAAAGKPTIFYVNGKKVDVDRFLGKLGKEYNQDSGPIVADGTLPTNITCHTPPPESNHPDSADASRLEEMLTRWLCDYDKTQSNETDRLYLHFYITRTYSHGLQLFWKEAWRQGGDYLQRAFKPMHLLLDKRSSATLFRLIAINMFHGDAEICHEFWKYLANYSAHQLPEGDELRLILALAAHHLSDAGLTAHMSLMSRVVAAVVDRDPYVSVPQSSKFIWYSPRRPQVQPIRPILLGQWNTDAILEVGTTDPMPGGLDRVHFQIMFLCYWGREEGWGNDDIFRTALLLLDRIEQAHGPGLEVARWQCWAVIALYHKAQSNMHTGETEDHHFITAVQLLGDAIDAEYSQRGVTSDLLEMYQVLESWHEEAGNAGELLRCRERREAYEERFLRETEGGAQRILESGITDLNELSLRLGSAL
ncbi:uncharacterized protein JN550_006543 [Neoarthrinium moseri]|uniref:uncharacterized protein n=1 Tax=Neoarthrinium moseri TaxID=1658444 RepID=UPI001FDBC15C|nr:uncharacterized protein JN550_006543 [Neoarthrinium moseri]KAI1868055.1 hypothetical protein JN550_006543 [Neoarthrinium moseri]